MADSDDERRGKFTSERKSEVTVNISNKRKRDEDVPDRMKSLKPKPGPVDFSAPVINTFKQWMMNQDDYISPALADKGYNDYTIGERKKHIQQFFLAHKDEEWFRQKYHPVESEKFQNEREIFLRERFYAWKQLWDEGVFKSVLVDLENQTKIVKLLDAVIMLMEENTTEDVINFINDGSAGNKRPKIALIGSDGNPPSLDDDEGLLDEDKNEDTEDGEVMETKKPIPYKSLYIKSISPKISKHELATVCKQFEGFKRVAMEIIPVDKGKEKRFTRRAWLTFDDTVDIKEISYQLNKRRVKEQEISTVIEKPTDLKDRVRSVPGLSNHSSIAFRDLKLAVQICERKDKKMFAFSEKSANKKSNPDEEDQTDGLNDDESDSDRNNNQFWDNSVNPIYLEAMKFIHEYEDMYQERLVELLDYQPVGLTARQKLEKDASENNENDEEDLIEIDAIEDIFNVLDPLILYLRVVHSIDFYAQADYSAYEDEHPNRCLNFHVRGPIPGRGLSMKTAKDWVTKFNSKIEELLLQPEVENLTEEQAEELGLKNETDEVEKFIEDNTNQLETDKFLCPLSGKKFKGRDYVRKHILNKHGDKINNVKAEVAYFNRYVVDGNKDGPSEPRFVVKSGGGNHHHSQNGGGYFNHQNGNMQNSYRNNYNNNYRGNYRDNYHNNNYYNQARPSGQGYQPRDSYYDKRARYSSHNHQEQEQMARASGGRGMVDYRDLDAPENMDMFG